MLHTSTVFDKTRNPSASVALLLNFYQQELEYQRVHQIRPEGDNCIHFENRTWGRIGRTRFGNQYFCFSMGYILVEDHGNEFQVYFGASLQRILIRGGTLAAVCVLLAFIASGGFNWIAVALGGLIFLMVSVVNYIYTRLFFPVYFSDLHDEMEESLQNLP